MTSLFTRNKTPGRAGQVKAWVSQHFELTEADLVSVAELACHEPGCPPIETVVTVYGADGRHRTWRLHKPLAEIAATDVAALEAQI